MEQAIQVALGRLAGRVEAVAIVLRDVNGPKGGCDKWCRMTAHLLTGEAITLTGQSVDILSVVAGNAERLGLAIAKALQRRRQFSRVSAAGR